MATTPKTAPKAPTSEPDPKEKGPGKVETIEDQGIGAQDPYPTGSPPAAPEEETPPEE